MEFALSEKPRPTADGHTTDRCAKLITTESNISECMKRMKALRESKIYLYNFEYLKNNYDKYIRDDFLYAFGAFYCDKVMKIPNLDRTLKTECYHRETEMKYRHYEFATYMENIITWLDLKLKHFNEESSKTHKKIQEQLFNTSYIQQQSTTNSLKALDSNTDSQGLNNKSRSVANSQNDIIPSPDITISKNEDFPVNNAQNKIINSPDVTSPKHDNFGKLTNDHKKEIDMVNNAQNKIINSPDVTSPKHDNFRKSTNDHKKEIDMVNNAQNKIIKSPDVTSPNHDNFGNSTNDHKKKIDTVNNAQNKIIKSPDVTSLNHDNFGNSTNDHKKKIDTVNNAQNKIITLPGVTSPKHDNFENLTNDHKKKINMVNNAQNKIINSPDVTSPKHDNFRKSTNDHKKEIDMVNNAQNKIITLPDVTSPKHDNFGNLTNDHKKKINMVNNAQNKIITLPDVTSPKHDNFGNLTNDHKKKINMVNNAQNKIITLPDVTSPKHDVPSSSTNDHGTEISKENNQRKVRTYSKHISTRSTTRDHKKKNDEIKSNLVNISSAIDSILTESQLKNPNITGDVKESTLDNLKININYKVDKLYSAQTSSSVIGEKISNMCLETPSKSISSTQTNKQANNKSDKTTTKLLKRSNSVTDSEHKSKKKKIEKPSPSIAERKTNTNNNKNSVNALNESIKQVTKNLYSRNSKGETKLHSACAKGKLDLVTSLLEDGFNPNVKDNAGWTPLHEAVKCGNLDIVKELIKFGAYLNVPGFEYESPLYTAIKYGKFEISKTILNYGADASFINIYGDNVKCLNKEKLSELLENQVLCKSTQICCTNYKFDETVIALNNVSLKSETVNTFCKQFNIKLVQNIWKEKQFSQVTHMVVPKTTNNTCDVNLECLTAIANGLFIINENWISDSLDKNKLMKCENYEVSGTTLLTDCNGPKISRINKQKLYPKLFDAINIHVFGSNGWNQFTIENLKKLIVEFGAKLLIRMPNPEDCPTNIIPYHCRNNDQMLHVSNIILYTVDSNRLIKYNMKHLKAFHISWFMEAVQKYSII
ncbi:hypothetical protein QTP88_004360 [Uroleucon formosanum]